MTVLYGADLAMGEQLWSVFPFPSCSRLKLTTEKVSKWGRWKETSSCYVLKVGGKCNYGILQLISRLTRGVWSRQQTCGSSHLLQNTPITPDPEQVHVGCLRKPTSFFCTSRTEVLRHGSGFQFAFIFHTFPAILVYRSQLDAEARSPLPVVQDRI